MHGHAVRCMGEKDKNLKRGCLESYTGGHTQQSSADKMVRVGGLTVLDRVAKVLHGFRVDGHGG
jgi:hypothetical protein